MKKILITVGMIILFLGIVGGVIIYNKHNGFDFVDVDSNIVNEEIEICNIFEYGDYVYYVLPKENDPYNGKVICKMKKDGTDKEIFLNKTPGNMRVYKNYLFDGKYRVNLDTTEEKCYSYDNIIYMNNEIMIYQKTNGFGVVNMDEIDNWNFDEKGLVLGEKRQDWNILYVDGDLVIYSANENLYTIRTSEVNSNQQGKFLIAEGNYAKFLIEKDGEVYFYINEDENIHLYRFNKENEELKCVFVDTLDLDLVGILSNRKIGNIAIKGETILCTLGSYQGSANMWYGSTIKINKDGTGKEVLEEFNESDLVKTVDDKLYYEVFSQNPSVWYWNEYVNGKSLRIDDFESVEKEKYKFTENKDKIIISQLYDGEYKESITIPKKNKELYFVSGEIKEVGNWLYVYLYEKDFNGSSWRGFNHLEFYRISKDYKVVQALDDNYVVKNPYSKLLSINNVRLKNDLNVGIKLSFVPYGNNVDLTKGMTSGKYVIETFCQANENADKLEIENVQFSSQQANLIFDDYDFDKNPDFIFEYTNASNATENIKYEISENAKLENIKKIEEYEKLTGGIEDVYGYVLKAGEKAFEAKKNGKYGVIDDTNKELIAVEYDEIKRTTYLDVDETFYYSVKKNDKWGVMNLENQEVIPVQYDEIGGCFYSYCEVRLGDKWGIVSINPFKPTVPCKYKTIEGLYVESWNEYSTPSIFKVTENGRTWGIVDWQGTIISECMYEEIKNADHWMDYYFMVKHNSKWGVLDISGKKIIDFEYDDIEFYGDYNVVDVYRYLVKKDGKYGLVDETGKELVKCKYATKEEVKNTFEKP